ncbi:hypothetical protein NON20_15580 [Synechocystis sp. B12]|nr:hypothetical protein NON20_15580 [Synechocystis sp. B12]
MVVPFSLLLVYPLHQLGILYLAIAIILGDNFWSKLGNSNRPLAIGIWLGDCSSSPFFT